MNGGRRKLRAVLLVVILLIVAVFASGNFRGSDLTLVMLGSMAMAFLAGAGRMVWRPAPFVMGGLVLLAYVGFITWQGVHTAQCPHCFEGDGDRLYYFSLEAWLFGFIAVWTLVCIAAGSIIASAFRRARAA